MWATQFLGIAAMNESTAKSGYLQFLRDYPTTTPGTKGGEMLRQYWHPVCLSKDLRDLPYGVRMLGEDLVAFRTSDGRPALLARRCPHRCASLEYGQVGPAGLMCSYHGWTFDGRGNCVDMPLEPVDTPLKKSIHQTWYPTEEWGGVVWCYMGADKENPPPLPKIDILARSDGEIILERGKAAVR
jgi:phenylpropionate dioxygenase-like ring-hydroxylating dioxygenase large terminal subunit